MCDNSFTHSDEMATPSINEQLMSIIKQVTKIMDYEEDICGDNYDDWEQYDDIRTMLKDMIK